MSTFLIVLICVVAFVIGQASMLRPSQRENFLMKLRAEARKMGLHARLLPPPEWYRGDRRAVGLLACYSLTSASRTYPYFRAEPLPEGGWFVRAGDASVLTNITLPEITSAFIAIEAQGNAVSVWWQESLGAEALPDLQKLLSDVAAQVK